jgi:hypothetical protein
MAGDPTVLNPPFPLLPLPELLSCHLPVREPTQLHGPAHVRRILPASGRALNVHRPNPRALTWNFVKVLTAASLTYQVRCCVFLFRLHQAEP